KSVLIILIPILLLPLPIVGQSRIASTAYAVIIIASFWVLELVPLAVTALLPIFLFPILGVLPSKDVVPNYFNNTIGLFVGGLTVAVAIEHTNFHKRIALYVLVLLGAKPHFLFLGFMIVTAFLSMWISNSATAAMMIPIATAVISELSKNVSTDDNNESTVENEDKDGDQAIQSGTSIKQKELLRRNSNDLTVQVAASGEANSDDEGSITFNRENKPVLSKKKFDKVVKGLILCVPYAANIGGIATLTGTPPNLVLSGIASDMYPKAPQIDFARWFVYGCPTMIIVLFVAWLWLVFFFAYDDHSWRGIIRFFTCNRVYRQEGPDRSWDTASARKVIQIEYKKLGKMTYQEWVVGILGIVLVLLWLTRNPGFIPGWAALFPKGYVSDATSAILIAFLLHMIPDIPPWKYNFFNPPKRVGRILTFDVTQRNLSWNVILLLGGSFALAKACELSGLSNWLGQQMNVFSSLAPFLVQLLICIIICFLTEIMSNTATATIFLPLVGQLAQSMNVNPYYFMLPTTVAASFAFMLPAATPPNAIAFSSGYVRSIDMVKTGLMMNFIGILILVAITNTLGIAAFNLSHFPEWAY
ncbi:uncharacterized protein TRIADDRAFT_12696, partial [Trichoplax adhaerens]